VPPGSDRTWAARVPSSHLNTRQAETASALRPEENRVPAHMTEREHDPVEAARPEIGGRDKPNAIHPDAERPPDRGVPEGEPDADPQQPVAPDPE
jgi:hypothetical protein